MKNKRKERFIVSYIMVNGMAFFLVMAIMAGSYFRNLYKNLCSAGTRKVSFILSLSTDEELFCQELTGCLIPAPMERSRVECRVTREESECWVRCDPGMVSPADWAQCVKDRY